MKLALDTNILVYAEGWCDAERCRRAQALVARLDPERVALPVQVLGELHRVLTGKAKCPPQDVRLALLTWCDTYDCLDTTVPAMLAAQDLVVDHQLPVWDALILAVAAQARCRLLLSEDFQDGFTWSGVTVVNPFAAQPSPLLGAFLAA